jgi:nitronate monooxygenase
MARELPAGRLVEVLAGELATAGTALSAYTTGGTGR